MQPTKIDPFWEGIRYSPLALRRRALYEGLINGLILTGQLEGHIEQNSAHSIQSMEFDALYQRYLACCGLYNRELAIFDVERISRWDESSLEGLQPLIVAPQGGAGNVALRKITWLPQDNGLLIASHRERNASILETESLRCAETIKVNAGPIWSHSVSTFMHASVAFATSHYARIADLRAGCCVQTIGRGPSTSLGEVEWVPGEEFQLQLSYEDCRVEVWDIRKTDKVSLVALRCPFQDSASTSSSGEIAFISLQTCEPVWMQQYIGGTGNFCIIENVPVPLLAMEGSRTISFLNLWNGELEFGTNIEFDTFGLIFNTRREEFYLSGAEWNVYVYGPRHNDNSKPS